MALCIYCKAETELHINGQPVCIACEKAMSSAGNSLDDRPPVTERPTLAGPNCRCARAS